MDDGADHRTVYRPVDYGHENSVHQDGNRLAGQTAQEIAHSSTEKALVLPITIMLYMVVVTVPMRKLLTMPATGR